MPRPKRAVYVDGPMMSRGRRAHLRPLETDPIVDWNRTIIETARRRRGAGAPSEL